MATNFPASLDTLTNPTSSDSLSSPSHSAQHANVNDAVEALQAKVGVDGSAVTTSLDYKVAQQGLTLVKSQTIGSSVSSVTVTDAFSSTFDNYRIVINGINCSVTSGSFMKLQLGAATTQYYGSFYFDRYTGTNTGTSRQNNGSDALIAMQSGNNDTHTSFDVIAPNLASSTMVTGQYFGFQYAGWFAFFQFSTTQHTAFTVFPSGGTMTGGTIRVYGYNNG